MSFLRQEYKATMNYYKNNLVLSTELITGIGHRKEIRQSNDSIVESLYGGQFTLSTQLINSNYVVILPTDAAPQFL